MGEGEFIQKGKGNPFIFSKGEGESTHLWKGNGESIYFLIEWGRVIHSFSQRSKNGESMHIPCEFLVELHFEKP